MYHGDIRLGDTIDIKFTTVDTTGLPTTLAGSPVLSAYPGNSTTELTAGITLTVDFDGRTGMHNARVVATGGNGYATATNYVLVITTGTVGGASVVGYCIGSFSIEARSALMPTTATRTLVVDAAGLADANAVKVGPTGAGTAQTARDLGTSVLLSSGTGTGQVKLAAGYVAPNWGDVGNPTTALALTNTSIIPTQKVDVDTIKTNPVVNGGTVTFPTTATLASTTNISAGTVTTATNVTTVNGLAAGVITAASIANDAITDAKVAADVTIASVTGAVGSVTAGVTVTTNNDKTGYGLSAAAVQAVWDALTSVLSTAGSIGKLLVDNINATIGSRSTYAGGDTSGVTTLLSRILGTLAAGTHQPQGGDGYARIGAPAGASLSADVASVKTDTGTTIPTNQTTILARLGSWTGSGLNTVLGAFRALMAKAAALTPTDVSAGTTYDNTTDALEALRDRGDAAWITGGSGLDAAGVRAAVGLGSANLDTQLDALPTNAELATALAGADDATLAAIAALNNLSAAGVRTAVGLGSANLDTQLAAIAAYIDTEVAAIKAKTDTLPTDPADASDIAALFTGVSAAIAALNNLSSAGAQAAAAAALAAYGAATGGNVATGTTSTAATLLRYVQLLARSDAAIAIDNGAALAAINANGGSGGGTFQNVSEALQSLRDRGDTAWTSSPDGLFAETAYEAFPFHMVLDSDGITAATGLTIIAQIKVDTGTYGVMDGAVVERTGGDYYVPISNTDIPAMSEFVTMRFSAATARTLEISMKISGN